MRQTQPATGDSRVPRASLPILRIVPSSTLLLHEECDPERVERLGRRLLAEGVLRNPPLVAAIGSNAFVVLDGANRVTALTEAGVPDQLVQVVDYDDPAVVLEVWAHLLQDDGTLVRPDATAALSWEALPAEAVRSGLDDGRLTCGIVTARGAFGLAAGGDLAERVRLLAGIVAGYKGRTPIYRVQAAGFDELAREFPGARALVLFPRLTKADIRAISRLPVKLPTGISRHVVPLRALRVNLDLSLLRGAEPVAVKQARLDELIRGRLLEHRVRHYPEPTVLYDE